MAPTAGLQREEELGGGGENDECEETNFISIFFLPWAPANVCIFRRAGGGEVATEGGKDRGKGDKLQAFPCFFFFLWLGDRKGSGGTAVVFPTSSQQGGGWKIRFSGERKWHAFGFRFVCFYLRSQVLYFTSSCHYKLNLPIKRAPTWRPPGFTADFLFLLAAPLIRITRWPSSFILKKHHPTRITSCVPVQLSSSERCPTVHLSVCHIAMATNIRPRS